MKTLRSRRAGFTLIEIMVVVGIMGLILMIGIPNIYQMAKKEGMRRALTDMKEVLAEARRKAILSGKEAQLKFYPMDRRFEITGGAATVTTHDGATGDAPTESSAPPGNNINAGTLPADISFGMLQVNLLNFRESDWTRVRFFPNGTSDELRLVLVSETGEVRGLELESTTGFAHVVSDLQEIRGWE